MTQNWFDLAMDSELSAALKVWGIDVVHASSVLMSLLGRRFPSWLEAECFAAALPVAQVELKTASRRFGYLWPEEGIVEALDIAPGTIAFCPLDRSWMAV